MGYELNIQREDENNKISKQEWIGYMESDPEFERIGEIIVKSPEHWIIEKMISIAENLNVEVIVEEG